MAASVDIDRHNRTVLEQLTIGDLVEFSRGLYSHWAVYIGDGMIAHLAGEDDDGINANVKPEHLFTISGKHFNKARVCLDKFLEVAGSSRALINNSRDKDLKALPPQTIVRQALERVGEVGYSLIFKNCEHFAKWCRYGVEKSDQVDTFVTGAAFGVASAALLGLVAGVLKYWGGDKEEEKKEKKMTQ